MKFFDYKENKEHGRFDFPIEYYFVDSSHPQYDMPYHWHTQCEIIRILKGEFSISINGNEFLALKNDLIFIHDGMLHGGTPKDCIYECIVFNMDLLLKQNNTCTKQIQDIINHNKFIEPKLPMDIPALKINCNYLFEAMKSKNVGYEFITQGSLYHIIGTILQHELYININKNIKKTQEKILQFKKVLSLIEEEYTNTISLNDLSKSAGMTPKYFCRFFHEMSNRTPIEYLNTYRIEIACEQLLTTDFPITEIALNCGFNDVSYFIKSFKKYKGITPKQYIKSTLCNTKKITIPTIQTS